MDFREKLDARWAKGARICVGLDPSYPLISDRFKYGGNVGCSIMNFNGYVVEQTGVRALAYKANLGFYLAQGWRGIKALEETSLLIRSNFPDVPIILDGKFGDIGNTAEEYAKFAFDICHADAVTHSPYLGLDSAEPFLMREGKGVIILCRTSNKSASEFQDLRIHRADEPWHKAPFLYEYIAQRVASHWNVRNNCALVVGATYPDELKRVRDIVGGDIEILLPGIGKQGGDLEATIRNGVTNAKRGIIVNAGSSIIFAEEPGRALALLTDEFNRVYETL